MLVTITLCFNVIANEGKKSIFFWFFFFFILKYNLLIISKFSTESLISIHLKKIQYDLYIVYLTPIEFKFHIKFYTIPIFKRLLFVNLNCSVSAFLKCVIDLLALISIDNALNILNPLYNIVCLLVWRMEAVKSYLCKYCEHKVNLHINRTAANCFSVMQSTFIQSLYLILKMTR